MLAAHHSPFLTFSPTFSCHPLLPKLIDLDLRAKEALAQIGLDDVQTFQACLEARSTSERAALMLEGVQREAARLARRAALQRALDAS